MLCAFKPWLNLTFSLMYSLTSSFFTTSPLDSSSSPKVGTAISLIHRANTCTMGGRRRRVGGGGEMSEASPGWQMHNACCMHNNNGIRCRTLHTTCLAVLQLKVDRRGVLGWPLHGVQCGCHKTPLLSMELYLLWQHPHGWSPHCLCCWGVRWVGSVVPCLVPSIPNVRHWRNQALSNQTQPHSSLAMAQHTCILIHLATHALAHSQGLGALRACGVGKAWRVRSCVWVGVWAEPQPCWLIRWQSDLQTERAWWQLDN